MKEPGGRKRSASLAVLAGTLLLAAQGAAAGDVAGFMEFALGDIESSNRFEGLPETQTETNAFVQRYNLTLQQSLWPNVKFMIGGLFEKDAISVDGSLGSSDATTSRLRPFFDLKLGNAIQNAQINWSRDEDKVNPENAPTITEVTETLNVTGNWRPEGLPTLRVRFLRTDNYDTDRAFRDADLKGVEVGSDYKPVRGLDLYYQARWSEQDDRINGNERESETHSGRVDYSASWVDSRFQLSTDYNVNHRRIETTTSGSGEIPVPVPAFAGLSSLDNLPDDGPLAPNPALIDGDLIASAGVNLGLAAPPDDDLRNIGLDLVTDQEMNTFLVWVDRELPLNISSSFSWDVYASDDGIEWELQQTNAPAEFSTLFNRFEVRADNLASRYVKVVTAPLSPSVPLATDYTLILVTELEASLRVPAADVESEDSSTNHIYNMNFRSRILNSPLFYNEVSFFLTKIGDRDSEYIYSNGLSLNHRLAEAYLVTARVTHQVGTDPLGSRSGLLYSAALTADPLVKLRQRLTLSGIDESVGGLDEKRNSIYLLNVLQPYPGIDLNIGFGKGTSSTQELGRIENTQVNASATMVPHRTTTLNLIYRDDRRDAGEQLQDSSIIANEANIAYIPFPTIYLFASYRVEDRADFGRRTLNNYQLNWSPFPDGSIRLSLNFNETLRSDNNATERTITPNLRWNINRRSWFDLVYQRITLDSDMQNLQTDTLSGTLRLFF